MNLEEQKRSTENEANTVARRDFSWYNRLSCKVEEYLRETWGLRTLRGKSKDARRFL
jgi:hypothetical protein